VRDKLDDRTATCSKTDKVLMLDQWEICEFLIRSFLISLVSMGYFFAKISSVKLFIKEENIMFKFLKERKEKKERENRKRLVRKNMYGEMYLLRERDRFYKPTRSLEEIEAEQEEKARRRAEEKRRAAEEKKEVCSYFGLSESLFDDKSDNYYNLKSLYNINKDTDNRILPNIFKMYDQDDWRYIFRFGFYETEKGVPFVNTEYFPRLVNFFKNPDGTFGSKTCKNAELTGKRIEKNDYAVIAGCVHTVLNVNKSFYNRGEDLYLDLDTFFDVLPIVYTAAKMKAEKQNKKLNYFLWKELSAATGAEKIFYAQYRAYVGEDANKEFWDRY
jgi:hypothetical protein